MLVLVNQICLNGFFTKIVSGKIIDNIIHPQIDGESHGPSINHLSDQHTSSRKV
jgi:hypothetical protein